MTLNFQANNILAPTPSGFRFDKIGFGPVEGTLKIDDDLIGLGIPLLDFGVFLDYRIGARLVFEIGLGKPLVDINYRLNEGSFVFQNARSEFNQDANFQLTLDGRELYKDRAIQFDTSAMAFQPNADSLVITAPGNQDFFIESYIDYTLFARLRDPFIGVDFFLDDYTFSPGGSVTIVDLDTAAGKGERIEVLPRKQAGDPIFSIDDGIFEGSFVKVPIPPDFRSGNPLSPIVPTVDTSANLKLPTLLIEDAGDPFINLAFDIDAFLSSVLPVPISGKLEAGDLRINLEAIRAQANANLAVGQELRFRPEDVHIQLELLTDGGAPTGQIVSGRIGDKLAFDESGLGYGKVRATYTLHGALEADTGLVLTAGLELGLLAGEIHWTGVGPDFHINIGPIIPLPSPTFSTGLITLISDSIPVTFAPIVVEYAIYTEKRAVGTDGPDNLQIGPSQSFDSPTRGFGGNDVIQGHRINRDQIFGNEGNDVINGSALGSAPAGGAADQGDVVNGGTGNDQITGGTGNDVLDGDFGSDLLFGGAGDDYLKVFGVDGPDELHGGTGVDRAQIHRSGVTFSWNVDLGLISGGTTTHTLLDGTKVSSIEAWEFVTGFGDDNVKGAFLDDIIDAGWGADTIDGGAGADRLFGGGGDDRLLFNFNGATRSNINSPVDDYSGGAGIDTLVINMGSGTSQDVSLNLSRSAMFGVGGLYADNLIDGKSFYVPLLIGADPNNTGPEAQNAAAVNVALKARLDVDALDFFAVGSAGRHFVTGGLHADRILTGGGQDRLDGFLGRDRVEAGGGDDVVVHRDEDELLDGGAGIDVIEIRRLATENDGFTFDLGLANATGYVAADGTVFRNFERLFFDGVDGDDMVRGAGRSDTMFGDGGDDDLDGRGGGDLIDGGAGDDIIRSTEGSPQITGANSLRGGLGADTLILDWSGAATITQLPGGGFSATPFAAVIDLSLQSVQTLANGTSIGGFERIVFEGGDGNDVITGGDASIVVIDRNGTFALPRFVSDVIDGGGGDDIIVGALGRDIMSGGEGNDTVTIRVADGDTADGGDGFDTLIIDLRGTSFTGAQFESEFIDYTVTGRLGPAEVQDVVVKLPNGGKATNFERVEFILSPVAEAAAYDLTDFSDLFRALNPGDSLNGRAGDDLLIGLGRATMLDGGIGNDILDLRFETDPLEPDPAGPLLRAVGGLGDDRIEFNSRSQIDGGDGLDVLLGTFQQVTAGLDLNMRGGAGAGAMARTGPGGGPLSNWTNIETVDMRLGGGNDSGQFNKRNATVDFGGGNDRAVVDYASQSAGQFFAFQALGALGGAAMAAAQGETGDAPAANGQTLWLTDGEGLQLANFEELSLTSGSGNDVVDLRGQNLVSDVLLGGGVDQYFAGAGVDRVNGEGGNDAFYFGAFLGSGDEVNGGLGADVLALQGNYGSGQLGGVSNIETLALLAGNDTRFGDLAGASYSYALTASNVNVAAGGILTINSNGLRATENLTFNGAAETDGGFAFFAGLGSDTLTGGGANDGFMFGPGGRFTAADRLDGGAGGGDQLGLRGDYSALITFTATTMVNVESIALVGRNDLRYGPLDIDTRYNLKLADATGTGAVLTINGNGLAAAEWMRIDGSAETSTALRIIAGLANDELIGGGGADQLYGNLGADMLRGGGGNDLFIYRDVAESGGRFIDRILDLAQGDKIDLSFIDAVAGGADNAFQFVGMAAFSAAGQLRLSGSFDDWRIEGDVNGDGVADLSIRVTLADPADTLVATDFVL
jgi:Ca2+-binding RTX toxin-like protein